MLEVSCADLGADCGWVATADTADELKEKIWAHARARHRDMIEGMSEMDKVEMEAQIDALIEMQQQGG